MARKKNMTRRKIILKSTFVLVKEHGLGGVSLQMIADDAGISKSLLQSYYPHKTELINDILHNVFSTILRDLNKRGIASSNEYTAMMVFLNTILELGVYDEGIYNVLNSIFGNSDSLDDWVRLIILWMNDEGLKDAFGNDKDMEIGLTYMVAGGASLYTKRDQFKVTAEEISIYMVNSFLSTFMGFTREQIEKTIGAAKQFIKKTDISEVSKILNAMFDEDSEILA